MFEEASAQKTTPQKFAMVGLITSEDFQKCRYALTKLYKSFPEEFDPPDIRPVLDVEWNEFIQKHQRRLGNGLWSIKNQVVVFKDGEFLGDFEALYDFIWKKWRFVFNEDWHSLASRHLVQYLDEKTNHFRQLVYMTIAINNKVIGSLLFQLYNDVVPLASENFLNRCRSQINGYLGTPIHRIVKNSWIQCGGYDLTSSNMRCENYVVPHDRRGVLSMCNNGRHKDNSTQFHISLDSVPWMDYRYVAFGQLLQGDNVLKSISEIPTYYQAPTSDIRIVKCGEFSTRFHADSSALFFRTDEINQWKKEQDQDILTYLKAQYITMGSENENQVNLSQAPLMVTGSCDSILDPSKMKFGTYSLRSDLKQYGPFSHLPDIDNGGDEGEENNDSCDSSFISMRYTKKLLYDYNVSPASSDFTL